MAIDDGKGIRWRVAGKFHLLDVNETNVLGMGGRLALVFGALVEEVWSGRAAAVEPGLVKELMGERHVQFTGFSQHDAQEFLSFLIDGLHEDLNRVLAKPYVVAPTGDPDAPARPDADLAAAAWDAHVARNDSLIVDLLHGQLKSRLQCPLCTRVSITFDPYVYLPVPFPKKKRSQRVYFWPADHLAKPTKVSSPPSPPSLLLPHPCGLQHMVLVEEDAKVGRLLEALGAQVGIRAELLDIYEAFGGKIYKDYTPEHSISDILASDIIHIWEKLDPAAVGEPVVNVVVFQRLIYPLHRSLPTLCCHCREPAKPGTRLLACSQCYREFYCNRDCQAAHWAAGHKIGCKATETMELVGSPFLLSVPKSKLTYAWLKGAMEARAIRTIDVFMPPHRILPVSPTRPAAPLPQPAESPMELEDPAPSPPTSSSQSQDADPGLPSEPGTPAGAVPDDPPPPGKPAYTRGEGWGTPDAKRTAVAASPEPAKVPVNFNIGSSPEERGGQRLFHIRQLTDHHNGIVVTAYTPANPKGRPIYPDNKAAVIKELAEDTREARVAVSMDWLTKLGSDDYIFVESKKEVDCDLAAADETDETVGGSFANSTLHPILLLVAGVADAEAGRAAGAVHADGEALA